jgi:pyrimidine-nucleoside phosphorylase
MGSMVAVMNLLILVAVSRGLNSSRVPYTADVAFVDTIARKRDGSALSKDEIDGFVQGVTARTIPDYQASALLMAIVLKGMTGEETGWLAEAMMRSGDRVDLSDLPGVTVGKHSTGGVGDKVSIVLAPVAAACGVIVPKMSGRGLGHTGGTLDKLESIPGYRIGLTIDEFKRVLREAGTSIIGQTSRLAPADKTLYALRDVTATVESVPLISASIMSKKLAEGSSALVLDVKFGDGAFMKTLERARELAASMVAIGRHAGVRTEAVLTCMDAPLGRAVGNSLEIVECLETLKQRGPAGLTELVRAIAGRMVQLAGLARDEADAARRVTEAIASGRALQTFARMVELQGGDARIVDDYGLLPAAPDREQVTASRSGYVTALRAEAIGRASHALGAGRSRVEDAIDHGVGIVVKAGLGERVAAGDPILDLHHRGGRGLPAAIELCRSAILVADAAPAVMPLVQGVVQ